MEIGFIALICVGLAIMLIGFVMMLAFQKGNRAGQDVQALVVSTRVSGEGRLARYFATLRYEIGGRSYTVETRANSVGAAEDGDTLTVGIDPNNPERIWLRRGRAYVFFYVLGGTLVLLSLILHLT